MYNNNNNIDTTHNSICKNNSKNNFNIIALVIFMRYWDCYCYCYCCVVSEGWAACRFGDEGIKAWVGGFGASKARVV